MKPLYLSFLTVFSCIIFWGAKPVLKPKLFSADNTKLHYVGRIDFTNARAPRCWAAGVYMKAKFKGTSCEILINDEVLYGNYHNYIEIAVDDKAPYRLKLTGKENVVKIGGDLIEGVHTLTICKNTEAGIGYIDFMGIRCEELMTLPPEPKRKIEFIGNSITCGAGMDLATIPCGTGQWYDQNNAYMAYGPQTARRLNAQWQLTSVSGIGLIHSCCDMKIVMPQVFDKVSLNKDSLNWHFKNYQPDIVTICLGQNDGIQDSTTFCKAYINFIGTIRADYPKADIICLTSPMGDEKLTTVLKQYITSIISFENKENGDKKVYHYFFSKRYSNGCGTHPDMEQHGLIADELTTYISQLKGW